jgi:hypothetical protein
MFEEPSDRWSADRPHPADFRNSFDAGAGAAPADVAGFFAPDEDPSVLAALAARWCDHDDPPDPVDPGDPPGWVRPADPWPDGWLTDLPDHAATPDPDLDPAVVAASFRPCDVPPAAPESTLANWTPSGWLALDLDATTARPASMSDTLLIDALVGWERVVSWASARQMRVLAEFGRRRPDDPQAVMTDRVCVGSDCAPDEVALALQLSRGSARNQLGRAAGYTEVLTATLGLLEQGRLDRARANLICDTVAFHTPQTALAVQARVLPKAPEQTLAQLRAALWRALIAVDPRGAAERHRTARKERRVTLSGKDDGMASLWAYLAAPDAIASYEWLTRLARSLGKDDPRPMDARRADLLVDMLTGRLELHDNPDDTGHQTDDETGDTGTDGNGNGRNRGREDSDTDGAFCESADGTDTTGTDTTGTNTAGTHTAGIDTAGIEDTNVSNPHECSGGNIDRGTPDPNRPLLTSPEPRSPEPGPPEPSPPEPSRPEPSPSKSPACRHPADHRPDGHDPTPRDPVDQRPVRDGPDDMPLHPDPDLGLGLGPSLGLGDRPDTNTRSTTTDPTRADPTVADPTVADPTVADATVADATDPGGRGAGRRKRKRKLRRGCGKRPARAGKPLVHVIIPYSTLTGADDQPCELAGYGPIPADLARHIAADAVWKRLVTDPLSGAVLDHGRDTYRPPTALAEFVRARDLHCRMPGCRRQAINCELDHTIDWANGGTTTHTNLYAGCLHDHRIKDRPGWTVRQTADGRVEWTTPTGHRYHTDPHDYRPDNDPDPPLLRLPSLPEPLPEHLPEASRQKAEDIERFGTGGGPGDRFKRRSSPIRRTEGGGTGFGPCGDATTPEPEDEPTDPPPF